MSKKTKISFLPVDGSRMLSGHWGVRKTRFFSLSRPIFPRRRERGGQQLTTNPMLNYKENVNNNKTQNRFYMVPGCFLDTGESEKRVF